MKISSLQLSHNREKEYQTTNTSDELIIEGILKNSNRIITEVYKDNFTKIKKMVWSFKNTLLDPEDIFQEGLTRAIMNVQAGKFRGESSFSTYLNSICRIICLKQLSKTKTVELNSNIELTDSDSHFEMLNEVLQIRKNLDNKCRAIIDLRFSLKETTTLENADKCPSFDEIADQLQLSAANARQRFKRCLDKLRELVSSSPELNEYFV